MSTKKQMAYKAPESSFELIPAELLLCNSIGTTVEDFNDVTDIEW